MTIDDIRALLSQRWPEADLRNDTHLLDCGLDSLDLATTIPMTEHTWSVRVNESAIQWNAVHTVGELLHALVRATSAP